MSKFCPEKPSHEQRSGGVQDGYKVLTAKKKRSLIIPMETAKRVKIEKASQVQPNVNVLFAILFDYNGVMHSEFLRKGCAVSKEYYLEVVGRLCEAIRKKCLEFWNNQPWIMHHLTDNDMFAFFGHNNNTVKLGLDPSGFSLLIKLKTLMK